MRYRLLDASGRTVAHNLNDECGYCLACDEGNTVKRTCPVDNTQRRLGRVKTSHGEVSVCSALKDDVKSKRVFRSHMNIYTESLEHITSIRSNLAETFRKDKKRLLHNLTSLNAHCIQEIYALVPQETLTRHIQQQYGIIRDIITSDTQKATTTILRIAKHNLAMKSEFAAMRHLDQACAKPVLASHPIRKVVLNVLHVFFPDFSDIGVRVEVGEYHDYVQLDYDTFHVALYHVIDNATKYVRPQSDLSVSFEDRSGIVSVVFTMHSIPIPDRERKRIGEEGFSGELAKQLGLAGDGLGMFRTQRLIALNDGNLIVKPNVNPSRSVNLNGTDYQENQFILTLRKAAKRKGG